MRYARVENGIVREIIDFDPKGRFVKDIEKQFVPCEETTVHGDEYKDGKFNKLVPRDKTQEEIVKERLEKIKTLSSEIDAVAILELMISKNILKHADMPSNILDKITEIKSLKQDV